MLRKAIFVVPVVLCAAVFVLGLRRGGAGEDPIKGRLIKVPGGAVQFGESVQLPKGGGTPVFNDGRHSATSLRFPKAADRPGELTVTGEVTLLTRQKKDQELQLVVTIASVADGDVVTDRLEPFQIKGGPEGTKEGSTFPFQKVYTGLAPGKYKVTAHTVDTAVGLVRVPGMPECPVIGLSGYSLDMTAR